MLKRFVLLLFITLAGLTTAYADDVSLGKDGAPRVHLDDGYGNTPGSVTTPLSVATLVAAPVAVTPSDSATFTPGARGIKITVTSPGNIKFGFPNGVTWTDSFASAGVYQYPWGVNQIFVTGTTAVFSAWTF